MESKFKIGDHVWLARYGAEESRVTCPVCFGHRAVTLILGNGDECRLPCDYCGKGYEGPRGYVTERTMVQRAEPGTVESVTVSSAAVEYHGDHWYGDAANVFATEAEALARSAALAAEAQADEQRRVDYGKHDAKKTFAWNAGYHMREAKRKRADADRHDRMAVICKERAKAS